MTLLTQTLCACKATKFVEQVTSSFCQFAIGQPSDMKQFHCPVLLCICCTTCFHNAQGYFWLFSAQLQHLNPKVWFSYISSTVETLISDSSIFLNQTSGESPISLVQFKKQLHFKNIQNVQDHRLRMSSCSHKVDIHDTCGRVCGHMSKNTFQVMAYGDVHGAYVKAMTSSHYVMPILKQIWRFELFRFLGLNISVLQINLTQNCPFEALVISQKEADNKFITLCGRRPKEELFCAFHSILVVLNTIQFTKDNQQKIVFQYQVYDRHFFQNTIINNFFSPRPTSFLHKTFTFATTTKLGVFHIRVLKLSLVLALVSHQSDIYLLHGAVISPDFYVLKAGMNHTVTARSFQCLLLVQDFVPRKGPETGIRYGPVQQQNSSETFLPANLSNLTFTSSPEDRAGNTIFYMWTLNNFFLKVSIDVLIYDGPTSTGCLYGGFSLFHIESKTSEQYVECVILCNYDSSVNYPTSKQISFVLASSNGYVVPYSYKGVSSLYCQVTASVSSCQGILLDPCQRHKDNSFHSAIVKVWFSYKTFQIVQIHVKHCSIVQIKSNVNWGNQFQLAYCILPLSITYDIVSGTFQWNVSATFPKDIPFFQLNLQPKDWCYHSSFGSYADKIHLGMGDQLLVGTAYGDKIHSCKLSETNSDTMKFFHHCSAFKLGGAQRFGPLWFLTNGSHGGATLNVGHINGSVDFQVSIKKYSTISYARFTDMVYMKLKTSSDSYIVLNIHRSTCTNKFMCSQFKLLHISSSVSTKCQQKTKASLKLDKSIQLPHSSDDHFLTLGLTGASVLDLKKECTFFLTYSSKLPKEVCCDECCRGIIKKSTILKFINVSFIPHTHNCWGEREYCRFYYRPVVKVTTKLSLKSFGIAPELSLFPSLKRFITDSLKEQFVLDVVSLNGRNHCHTLLNSLVFKWQLYSYKSEDTKPLTFPLLKLIHPQSHLFSWDGANTECLELGKTLPQIPGFEYAAYLVKFVMKGTVDTFYPIGVFISSRRSSCRSLKVSHSALTSTSSTGLDLVSPYVLHAQSKPVNMLHKHRSGCFP